MKRHTADELLEMLGNYVFHDNVKGCGKNARIRHYEFGETMRSYSTLMRIQIIDDVYYNGNQSYYTRTTRKHLKNAYGVSYADIQAYIQAHPNRAFC